jgi:hypothetical protein
LKIFENRFLRRTSALKWDEIIGDWRKPHYEDLRIFYSSPNILAIGMN